MTLDEIQASCDSLTKAMSAKALKNPLVEFHATSFKSEFTVMTRYAKDREDRTGFGSDNYEFFKGSADEAFAKAEAFIAGLPSPEQTKFLWFAKALGAAIEAGKEGGIDLKFINPLEEAMKRLSKNALMAPLLPKAPDALSEASPLNDDVPF